MKHSFWLVNSLLLLLLCCTIIFMFFSQQRVTYKLMLEPQMPVVTQSYTPATIQTKLIYENDLFNTYHKTYAAPTQPNYVENTLPQPPVSVTPDKPVEEKRKFLPNLKVKLKGIIAASDPSLNKIIVADDQTQEQKSYGIGGMIEDGLLIKIFPNKAILLRSNGQQETLYLNERDIQEDALISQQKKYWVNVIHHLKDNHYLVDHEAFGKSVQNMGVLFDLLNITTMYENGVTKGLRIGNITPGSLGHYLGLQSQDLLTHCSNIPLTSLKSQTDCYNSLITKKFEDTITFTIERKGTPLTFSYTLRDLKDPGDNLFTSKSSSDKKPTSDEELQNERIKLLQKKYKFAPTAQDLRIQQKLISNKKNSEVPATLKKKE